MFLEGLTMTVTCSNCRKSSCIDQESRFCSRCGAEISESIQHVISDDAVVRRTKRKYFFRFLYPCLVVLGVSFLITVFVVFNDIRPSLRYYAGFAAMFSLFGTMVIPIIGAEVMSYRELSRA